MIAKEFIDIISGYSGFEYTNGLINVLSNISPETDINRNQAAKILHVYVRDICGVPDEDDLSILNRATQLCDLYDCRVCVNDITQVYVKGLMDCYMTLPGSDSKMFCGREVITDEEAEHVWRRMEALMK